MLFFVLVSLYILLHKFVIKSRAPGRDDDDDNKVDDQNLVNIKYHFFYCVCVCNLVLF